MHHAAGAKAGSLPRNRPVEGEVGPEHAGPVVPPPDAVEVAFRKPGLTHEVHELAGSHVGDDRSPGTEHPSLRGLHAGDPPPLDRDPRHLVAAQDLAPGFSQRVDEGGGQAARPTHRHGHVAFLGHHGQQQHEGGAAGDVDRQIDVRGSRGEQRSGLP